MSVTALPERRVPSFSIEPRGPFSLVEAARFWRRFTPAGHAGLDAEGHLHMAFPVEGTWQTAGVCVQKRDRAIMGQTYGAASLDVELVCRQTARILSLDVDGSALEQVGQRDQVAADLLRRYRGLRPVCFYSTYEAAVWAVLSQRLQMRQAARLKDQLRDALGMDVDIHGRRLRAFPSPAAVLDVDAFPGIADVKMPRLHAVARAALAGDLAADYLRSLPDDEALRQLQMLPGIGPFSSELILLRGAGHPDYLTLVEARFRQAVTRAYGLDHMAADDDLRRIADAWRPYRMWITFLLRQSVESQVHQ